MDVKTKMKEKTVKVQLKCGHTLTVLKAQVGYHTSKYFYCPKCKKMVERKDGNFWKNLKEGEKCHV
jgi:hypothetical protein